MKRIFLFLAVSATVSCSNLFREEIEEKKGEIEINFVENFGAAGTKADGEIPDTNSFILRISDSSGKTVYDGEYGAAPKSIPVESGAYTVEALSRTFDAPLFDAPQYGDSRIVEVKAGKTSYVRLNCLMINAGIILKPDSGFRAEYPDATLTLSSSDGTLMYGYSERRTAYFNPGLVSLNLNSGGSSKMLLSRILSSQQVLVLSLSAGDSGDTKSGISIAVDTTKMWICEEFTLGQEKGSSEENPLNVTQARTGAGLTDVWIYGYIVGGDLSSSKCSFEQPFTSRTNLVLATKSSCRDRDECISVQLATKGGIRDDLNLVDHPEHLGREILLRGDIVASYYGLPGLQSVTEYKWK